MRSADLGLLLVALGVLVVLTGFLVLSGALGWFGRLPGDLSWSSGNGRARVFVPVVSMLLVSLALTLVLNLVGRFLR
jgi:hypothetical protein